MSHAGCWRYAARRSTGFAVKASIAGRIRNTHLPKAKALLPLFEAVMNSFQAIEEAGGSGHRIQIIGERDGDIEGDKAGAFIAFSIIDTGSGFNDGNLDSFETVNSPYKAMRGGKGLGRFLWLKAFQRVEVTSHYREIGKAGLLHRSFAFTANDEALTAEPSLSDRVTPETTVRLSGFLSPYVAECPRPLEAIAQRLIVHFLPLFLDQNGPSISVSDGVDTIDLRTFFRENFAQLSTRQTLTVAGEAFTLDAFRLHGALADHHGLIFAADFREVLADRLAKYLPNLRNRLSEADGTGFYYLAFVQGAFLDAKANNERTDFAIPKDGGPKPGAAQVDSEDEDGSSLFDGELTLKMIRDEAIKAVTTDLRPFLDELNVQKQAALVSFIDEDAPQYRVLLKYSHEFIDDIAPHASKNEIELALHKQLYQREVRLKQEGVSILKETASAENADEYYARLQKFVEDENEIGKTSLAKYVVHRRVILELLDKYLSQDQSTGDYGLEKTIHSLVFPMRSTSEDVPFEQQNLWIIDERLTFHTFLSSDVPLNKTPVLENGSASRRTCSSSISPSPSTRMASLCRRWWSSSSRSRIVRTTTTKTRSLRSTASCVKSARARRRTIRAA